MIHWIGTGIFVLVCWFIPSGYSPESIGEINISESISACNLVVDAGPDTNVCDPGGLIGLIGSVTGNPVFYQWTPATGLNNPSSLTPTANITGPITYTLTAYAVDPANPNLVVNGDFELGNTGFSSDYTYVADQPGFQMEMFPEGTYTVINNPNLVHTGFSACNDHTGGGGNMMVINGAASLQDIWCQTIPIMPNTWYNVSAWVASVNPSSPAKLRFSINGNPIGQIVNAPGTPCQWVPFNATWNSGSNNSATICILNLNTALGGNDFAIDDISLKELCSVEDEVEITLYEEIAPEPEIDGPAFLCAGETGIYTADFPSDPPILSYEWVVPSGATILSGQGTTQVTVLWDDPQDADLCMMIETRCDMNEGCYEVTVGTVPELPLISGPTALCPGQIATLYTPEIDPDDLYHWILPQEVVLVSGDGTNEIDVEWAHAGDAEICLEVTNACGTTDNCTFLTLFPGYLTLFDTVLCQGTTIVINGNTYGNGIWTGTEVFTSINGCDSIVEIDITEATVLEFMFTEYLCPGDSVFVGGAFQTQAGTYVDSLTTISNCDSLVITEVIISPFDTTWITSTTCDPALAGTTTTTFSQGNCDSTVITTILLNPSDTTVISLFSCMPSDTGQASQLLVNHYGCDSLVITSTFLLSSDTTLFFQTTCDPSQVGTTMQSFINANGCDSTVITEVAFLQSDTTLISSRVCIYADTGTTSMLLSNIQGCDSLIILHSVYGGSDTTYLSETTCSPLDSGLSILPFVNQFGCDSIVSTYTAFLFSDTTFITKLSCQPQDTGTSIQLLSNMAGCDSLVITNTNLQPEDECSVQAVITVVQPLCFGDPAIVNVEIQIGLGPFHLTWTHQADSGFYDYPSKGNYSFPLDYEGKSALQLTSANGISIVDTIDVVFPPLLSIDIQSAFDYNGFSINCNGEKTGEAILNILSGGTPPLLYSWSDGSTANKLQNLSAGIYSVTVTDSNGCTTSDLINITEPTPIQYNITIKDIKCFGEQNGSVVLTSVQGGVSPLLTSLDGNPFEQKYNYSGLPSGNHDLVITDQNGCVSNEMFFISAPEEWSVHLGPDTSIAFGTSYELATTIQGVPVGTLQLNWSDGLCDDCLTRNIEPNTTTNYSVTVTDENGCSSEDEIRINVFIDRDLYVPNIFSPNGDQVNDLFTITSGAGIEEIEELTIFDRWGSLVYQEFHFQPDDPALAWDGRMKGMLLNPGVYVYKLIVIFKDQRRETRFGDVTLIR